MLTSLHWVTSSIWWTVLVLLLAATLTNAASSVDQAAYPPLVSSRGRTLAVTFDKLGNASAGENSVADSAERSRDAAVLLFRRQVHPPCKEAMVVLGGSVSGVPLVDQKTSQIEYEVVNLGRNTATDIRIYEYDANFPVVAFERKNWPKEKTGPASSERPGEYVLFELPTLLPGERFTRNLSIVPHTYRAGAAEAALFEAPSFIEPVHVYKLHPARLTYRIGKQGAQRTGFSSTESYLVVESARGFDRRALWHPKAWVVYLGGVGLLGVVPWMSAYFGTKQAGARPPRTT